MSANKTKRNVLAGQIKLTLLPYIGNLYSLYIHVKYTIVCAILSITRAPATLEESARVGSLLEGASQPILTQTGLGAKDLSEEILVSRNFHTTHQRATRPMP